MKRFLTVTLLGLAVGLIGASVAVAAGAGASPAHAVCDCQGWGGGEIDLITPAAASAGTAVTLSGVDLAILDQVTFDGVDATSFRLIDASTITAVVPTLTVANGTSIRVEGWQGGAPVSHVFLNYYGAVTISPISGALPSAVAVGIPYSTMVTASGGSGSFGFGLTSGALPAGLSLNPSSGAVSGTPSAVGDFSFSIDATDLVTTQTSTSTYSLHVPAPALTLPSSTAPGSSLEIQGTGFSPGSYDVVLHSTPVVLGSVTVGGDGVLRFSGQIPSGVTAGVHTIQIQSGQTTIATAALTVTAALAATGVDIAGPALAGVILLVLGVWALRFRQRRASSGP